MFRAYCFSAVFLVSVVSYGLAGQRVIGHISSAEGGFTPGIVIANTDTTGEQAYQLQPYTADGEALPPVSGSIESGATRYLSLLDLFGREDISHLVIEGEADITVSTTYQAVTPNSTPAHVHESAQQARNWRVYPGAWPVVWDGLAIVNMGEVATQVVIHQKDAQGEVVDTRDDISIEPFAKHLIVLSDSFNSIADTHFELSADQPTVVTALRGSDDSRFLWANLPVAQEDVPGVSFAEQYEVSVTANVKYGEGMTHTDWNSVDAVPMDLLLDVYEPIGAKGPRPAAVFIHGGGFVGGSKGAGSAVGFAMHFAARGFVVFSINYRLAGDRGTVPQAYLEHGQSVAGSQLDQFLAMYTAGRDAKAAIRWVHGNAAAYNLDVDRITVAGGSAGAITAIALGTSNPEDFRDELTLEEDPTLATTNLDQDSSVHAVIDFWGAAMMMSALIDAYQLENRFDATDSPLAIIHGTEDPTVPYDRALELETIYTTTGAHYELYTLEGRGHGPWSATLDGKTLNEIAFDFVIRQLQIPVTP